jgi:antitoxin component YwqK of YwqJK toxin-antitoxin module
MMKNILLLAIVFTMFASCKTKKMNQYVSTENKHQKRHGKWKEEYSSDQGTLTAVGKYKMGEKVGVWKTTFENKLYQKDKIRKNVTKTTLYHPNGKIMEKGQSKLDISDEQRHWYYFGDWKYYDEAGKLKYVKKYADGKKIDSISFQK